MYENNPIIYEAHHLIDVSLKILIGLDILIIVSFAPKSKFKNTVLTD